MSESSVKKFKRMARREARKLADQTEEIKVQALQEFFEFSESQPFGKRVRFCFKILFKKL